jgi:predicted TIM-barrel fold metal-dependent hydrolase
MPLSIVTTIAYARAARRPAMEIQRGTQAWFDQVVEDAIEPERRIIDPHHHLWHRPGFGTYMLEDLWADTGSGHRVEKTMFVECRTSWHSDGPEPYRPVGETEFIADVAHASREGGPGRAVISGIVAHADLRLGDALLGVLDAHRNTARGLLRGIRHSGAHDPQPEALSIPGRAPAGLYADESFRRGVRALGTVGLTYDTWHYHHQNRDYAALARAVPDTTFVLDHFGTPLGVGRFVGKRDEIFAQWTQDIAEIARCPNVMAKLGGLAMPDCGWGWDQRAKPASSDELVAAHRDYYLRTIDCFGPARCMFESNFPVDKRSISYRSLWNALKKIAAGFSEAEKHAMFFANAERVYRL